MVIKKFFGQILTALFLIVISPLYINANVTNHADIYKISPSHISITPVDINNFFRIDDNFYRGSQPDNYDTKVLDSLGIKTIINLRKPGFIGGFGLIKQRILAKSLGINYVNIPMSPGIPPTNEQIAYFFQVINNPENLPVYVHCAQGKDRTGIMTALYRIKKYNWTFKQAYTEMKTRGYHSFIFPKQKEFLIKYINKATDEPTNSKMIY